MISKSASPALTLSPYLPEGGLDDARDLALDRHLPLGADGAHGQGLLDDRTLGHGHRLVVLVLV
jgi:hypothetical protein